MRSITNLRVLDILHTLKLVNEDANKLFGDCTYFLNLSFPQCIKDTSKEVNSYINLLVFQTIHQAFVIQAPQDKCINKTKQDFIDWSCSKTGQGNRAWRDLNHNEEENSQVEKKTKGFLLGQSLHPDILHLEHHRMLQPCHIPCEVGRMEI